MESFPGRCCEKQHLWRRRLDAWGEQKKRIVLWGSGSKGVTFLKVLWEASAVDRLVDINPHKQGKFVAGTRQRVVDPGELVACVPDRVIVMNELYKNEISHTLREMGLGPEVVTA